MADRIVSGNGRCTLTVQPDGNLVLYHDGVPVWATNTFLPADPDPPVPPDPPNPPTQPPVITARLGLSYYTSATDPRVNIPEFAARLRDAGVGTTRVWLLDAWALGASVGTGCYNGFIPWQRDGYGQFDLWSVHLPYYDRLRHYVEAMNAVGLVPRLSGLDLYTWSDRKQGMLWVPDASRQPFRDNRQGLVYADDSAFERIGRAEGEDGFLGRFYWNVVSVLNNLRYTVELGNEMPEKALHARLRDRWREAGYTGPIAVNRQEDTPGQYANMRIGTDYDHIAYHGKRALGYLDEVYPEEPVYKTFRSFYTSGPDASRITLSSDGCRKSTDVNDAYDYDALAAVFHDARARGFSIEHQSAAKLRGFTEGRIDLDDLEVDWMRQFS